MKVASTIRAIHKIQPCTPQQLCAYMGEEPYRTEGIIDALYYHGAIVWNQGTVSLSPVLKRKWKNVLGR